MNGKENIISKILSDADATCTATLNAADKQARLIAEQAQAAIDGDKQALSARLKRYPPSLFATVWQPQNWTRASTNLTLSKGLFPTAIISRTTNLPKCPPVKKKRFCAVCLQPTPSMAKRFAYARRTGTSSRRSSLTVLTRGSF